MNRFRLAGTLVVALCLCAGCHTAPKPSPKPAPSNWTGTLTLTSGSLPAPRCWSKVASIGPVAADLTETSCDPTHKPTTAHVALTPELRAKLDAKINQLESPLGAPPAPGAKTALVDLHANQESKQFTLADNQPGFAQAEDVYTLLAEA